LRQTFRYRKRVWNSQGRKVEANDTSIVMQAALCQWTPRKRDPKTKEIASDGANREHRFFVPVVNGCAAGFLFFDLFFLFSLINLQSARGRMEKL